VLVAGSEGSTLWKACSDAFVEKSVSLVLATSWAIRLMAIRTLGPMAQVPFSPILVARLQLAEAVAAGARRLIDAGAVPQDGGALSDAANLIELWTIRMRVMREESLGPVVGIMRVKDDAEALRLMNDQ